MLIGYLHMFMRCCEHTCIDLISHVGCCFLCPHLREQCVYIIFFVNVHMFLSDASRVYEMLSLHKCQFSLVCGVHLFNSLVISFCCFHFMRPCLYTSVHVMSHVRLFLYTLFDYHSYDEVYTFVQFF
jgi:hypothetical protein